MRKYYPCPGCFGIVKYDKKEDAYICGICQGEWSVEQLEKELKRFNGEGEDGEINTHAQAAGKELRNE